MAEAPSARELEEIQLAIAEPKVWTVDSTLEWIRDGRAPPGHKFRAPLAFASRTDIQVEGLFVEGYFKDPGIPGTPAKLSTCLVFMGRRVFGIDVDGPSRHYNKVGVGLPFFRKVVDHPHVHFAVADAFVGYAEPLPQGELEDHWSLFMSATRITGHPAFSRPTGQMVFTL